MNSYFDKQMHYTKYIIVFSKAYVHYVFQNTVKCSLIVNHIKMAHSATCCCRAVMNRRSLRFLDSQLSFLDRHLKGQLLTISRPYRCVWKPT